MDPNKLSRGIVNLAELVARLRAPGGCPWDAEQTASTVKIYLLEEAYEVLEAIETSSAEDICSELGDLLFQILFLARMAEERDEFDFVDVVEKITEKMIRRHPHVFGKAKAESSDEVAQNWARIKTEERGYPESPLSLLRDIPMNLPALLRGHRLGERASKAGFEMEAGAELLARIEATVKTLRREIEEDEREDLGSRLGELLLLLVHLSRIHGMNSEHLMREANQRFVERFEKKGRDLREKEIEVDNAAGEKEKGPRGRAEDIKE